MSTDVSEVRAASIIRAMVEALIALMMESVRTSETSVDIDLRARSTSKKTLKFILAAMRT
jgi:proline dehydrogenase